MKFRNVDLLKGNIVPSLVFFALPILISSLFQQLYNAADTTIVGNYLGDEALAAVGASVSIFELIVGFAMGVANGMGIVVARYFGADDEEGIKRSVAASLIIGGCISAVVMLIGYFFLYDLLIVINTPEHILSEAYSYIYLIMMFFFLTFYYNLASVLLSSIGNSLTPLIILLISSVLNIALDIVFITVFRMGIKGAAIATVMAQCVSVCLSIIYIMRKAAKLVPEWRHFRFNRYVYAEILTQGLSMGFMASIVATGSVILQTSVNSLGVSIIAAQTTARRIFFFFTRPILAFATALMTFVSQNFGAGQYERIKSAVKSANIISVGMSIVIGIFLFIVAEPLIRLLSGSDNVELIESAKLYIYVSSAMYAVLGVLFNLRNSLQGINKKMEAVVSSLIELISKIVFVIFIIPHMGYLGVVITEPVIWIFMTAQLWCSWRRWSSRISV